MSPTDPTLCWPGKEEPSVTSTTVLLEQPELSYHAIKRISSHDSFDNMLIQGDNLPALAALQAEYSGQVRFIYLDPPYNTGKSFEHYDDDMSHNNWLTMLHQRLTIIRPLLADDGIIALQIDAKEMAYLKVLLDEVFGRKHCIGQIAVRMSHSAGLKRIFASNRVIKNTEYLLLYYHKSPPTLQPLYEKVSEFPVNYYYWITEFPYDNHPGHYTKLVEELYHRFKILFEQHKLPVNNKSISLLYTREAVIEQFVIENRERIVRKHAVVPVLKQNFFHLPADAFERVDTEKRYYFIGVTSNGSPYQLIPLTDKTQKLYHLDEQGNSYQEICLANLLGDWWDDFWRDMSRVDVEGGVLMKESKKPERLLQRLLQLCTQPGDLVLDCFLGSGTTAAVAHKMRRRWIGIEQGEHCHSLAAERLRRVIDGVDNTGITNSVNWQGGGGYHAFRIVPAGEHNKVVE